MFEVEVKALIRNYNITKSILLEKKYVYKSKECQLNHYFSYNDYSLAYLFNNLRVHLTTEQELNLSNVIGRGNNFSVRTRSINDKKTYFIIKYSLIDKNSVNGSIREEYEVLLEIPLTKLDTVLLNAGLIYSSKWSRQREIFTRDTITATIDLNAGYGYLLELEILTDRVEDTQSINQQLLQELTNLELKELDATLLTNMFDYYENHWDKFYGTNNYLSDDLDFQNYLSNLLN